MIEDVYEGAKRGATDFGLLGLGVGAGYGGLSNLGKNTLNIMDHLKTMPKMGKSELLKYLIKTGLLKEAGIAAAGSAAATGIGSGIGGALGGAQLGGLAGALGLYKHKKSLGE